MSKKLARFTLSSPALKDGARLPKKYAGNDPENANCDGDNVSLPLRWSNPPAGTKSFALTMFDPLGRRGVGVVHWVAYDIPATRRSLRAGEASQEPIGFAGGRNNTKRAPSAEGPIDLNALPGTLCWAGPCPRFTEPTRPYTIVLIATDIEPGALPRGLTYYQLAAALHGHALDRDRSHRLLSVMAHQPD